jgi:D-alanine-D-alanine ligase
VKKKIGLLFGGRSGEHEVSLVSAGNIAKSFDTELFEIVPLFISRSGNWYGPIPAEEIATAKEEQYADLQVILAAQPGGILLSAKDGHEICRLDAVFPIVHGTYGEDGVTQGLLELADIPYAGAGVTGSAVCMDKVVMRKILAYHNIPQVQFTTVLRSQIEQDMNAAIQAVESVLDYPVFIKPANGGSSVGINKAKDADELAEALRIAAKYDRKVLVEQGVTVREIEVSVMGNEQPMVSQPGEICSSNEFYDYKAKYVDNKSVAVIPANLPPETIVRIQELAVETYLALECEGFARVDFFVEEGTGNIYLNEVNSLPGFTDISMYPKMWEQAGISTTELLTKLIAYAEARHEDRKKNSIDC